ncbi:MAG: hypothetical protein JWM17_3229 [Actinobacteria bacterium]|nr:hypothetical protein [Actinomycetota bacterium]MCW3043245.1 hypothetical protein [Actinomycetota bacterium]
MNAGKARTALAVVRLVNGTIALVAPDKFLRVIGIDPEENQVATYFLRMFGIRTILLGLDLLSGEGAARDRAVKRAVVIHATDTVAAVVAGATGALPIRAAVSGAVTSTVNTALSVIARCSEPAN